MLLASDNVNTGAQGQLGGRGHGCSLAAGRQNPARPLTPMGTFQGGAGKVPGAETPNPETAWGPAGLGAPSPAAPLPPFVPQPAERRKTKQFCPLLISRKAFSAKINRRQLLGQTWRRGSVPDAVGFGFPKAKQPRGRGALGRLRGRCACALGSGAGGSHPPRLASRVHTPLDADSPETSAVTVVVATSVLAVLLCTVGTATPGLQAWAECPGPVSSPEWYREPGMARAPRTPPSRGWLHPSTQNTSPTQARRDSLCGPPHGAGEQGEETGLRWIPRWSKPVRKDSTPLSTRLPRHACSNQSSSDPCRLPTGLGSRERR